MKLNHLIAAAIVAVGLTAALPGCQTQSAKIPGNATLVASGTGNTTYAAPQDGTIYIYDKTWNKMVYSGDVKAGQIMKVDTVAGKVLVDNQPRVEQANVGGGSEFQFFMAPAPLVQRRTIIEESTPRNTTIERRTVIEKEVQP